MGITITKIENEGMARKEKYEEVQPLVNMLNFVEKLIKDSFEMDSIQMYVALSTIDNSGLIDKCRESIEIFKKCLDNGEDSKITY